MEKIFRSTSTWSESEIDKIPLSPKTTLQVSIVEDQNSHLDLLHNKTVAYGGINLKGHVLSSGISIPIKLRNNRYVNVIKDETKVKDYFVKR